MTTPETATTTHRPAPTRRRTLRRYIPPQHGAWAILALPWLTGVLTTGWHWLHLPLLLAWLTGYLASYYLLQAVKTRRPARFRTQILIYAAPTVLLGGLVLALRPQLLWYAPAYATLLAVNIGYAARRDERALPNDLASVTLSCLMIFVCATAAQTTPAATIAPFLAVTAYLTGTVLYVKTMIRERGNATYYRISVAYHLAITAVTAGLRIPVAILFLLLLARAVALPLRPMTPKQVGLGEVANSVLLLATVTLTT
ncbi:YwiC-like family protein [Dactylosporangium sp. NPDC005572]|uniref:YwiC-like family protein n=1 Tax=Dactylosporangium sp. NPDC005572 TaxID=3156889 RepID=UPI0033B8FA7E